MYPHRLILAAALVAFAHPAGFAAEAAKAAAPAAAAVKTTPTAPAEAVVSIPAAGLPTTWLQGEPVQAYVPGKLYIFECWATWCGPCLQAMPHMEALHQKFKDRKDVQIVGINVFDTVASEKLLPFLKQRGITVTYAMAADGKDGPVSQQWLKPLGVSGIPFAMAVRDGKLIWRGHPAGLEEALIEAMAKPDYSAAKAPQTREQRVEALRPVRAQIAKIAHRGDMRATHEALRKLAAQEQEERLVLPVFQSAFQACLAREHDADAISVLRLMVELYPQSRTAVLNAGEMALKSEELTQKDPEFARTCAERMLVQNPKDVAALEMKAAALLIKGDRTAALAAQEQALKNTKLRAEITALQAELAAGKTDAAK